MIVEIGPHKLIHGDCIEVMAEIGPVDHVITDPPYEKIMHENFDGFKGLRNDGHIPKDRSLSFDSIDEIRESFCQSQKAINSGWLIVFSTSEGVAPWRDAIERSKTKYKRACVWVKPDSAPQFNGKGPALGHEMIITAWAGPGHTSWNGGGRRGVFTHLVNPPDRDGNHPTEKPIRLMRELISLFSNPGQTILDPFMGSGTTGIACHQTGRNFIGIEKDKKYFDLAVKRITEAFAQSDLFINFEKQPKESVLGIENCIT